MRGGDLSNELAPYVGIRFERVIKTEEGLLNRAAKAYIEKILRTDVNLVVITNDRRKALAFLTKWHVPYTQVVQADSRFEIPRICAEWNLISYFDVEPDAIQDVNSISRSTAAQMWEHYEVA